MAPKPSLAELRQDAKDDAKMESAGEARQSEAKLMQAYPKSMPAQSAGSILREAMDDAKAIIEGEDRPPGPAPEPPRSSKDKDVDEMSDGSFEKVEEDVVMVTEEDYNMAEQVATQHKNEEDAASLELAGQTTTEFTFLTEASHLDVQKSLAELEEALAKLSTKDAKETKVAEETSARTGLAQGSHLITPSWSSNAFRRAPTRSRTRRRSGPWFQGTSGASCATSPLRNSMTWCRSSRRQPPCLNPPSTGFSKCTRSR